MSSRFSIIIAGAAMALFLAAVAFRSYSTARGIPLLAGDSRVFLPQTIPFHQRGELINAVWPPASKLDVLGKGRMTYHGFLFPMILSLFLWQSDYVTLARVLGVLQGAATLLFGVFLWSFARRWQWRVTPGRLLLIVLLAVGCANYIQGAVGRPEPLAALLLMICALLMERTPRVWHGWIAGVGIGALTAIDPIVGVLAGIAFAGSAAWWLRGAGWLRTVALASAVSLITFACCFLWYPCSFADWWSGTLRMGCYAMTREGNGLRFKSYLAQYLWKGSGWFLLGTLALALWSGIRLVRRQYRRGAGPACPSAFYAMLLVAGAAFERFVLYVPWAQYNILPFMPLVFLAIFYELGQEQEPSPRESLVYRRAAFMILAVASLGLAGDLLERIHIMSHGTDLPEARALFASIRNSHPGEVIALQEDLFTLTEDYSNVVFWRNARIPARATVLVSAQFYTGREKPAVLDGFRLVENHFKPERVSFLGVPVLTCDRGSGFAVYRRDGGGETMTLPAP